MGQRPKKSLKDVIEELKRRKPDWTPLDIKRIRMLWWITGGQGLNRPQGFGGDEDDK